MASSMIRPTAIVNPASVKMLSEKPPIAVPSSATRTLVGKDTAVTRGARVLRRERKIAKNANNAPRRPSRRRSFSEARVPGADREHTSELQSQSKLVCRLLLEKKKKKYS